ncbi:MAG: CBS domain-containing protein [Solirubrobacterales bacterium]
MAEPLPLSAVIRSPMLDRAGEKLGRVEDVIVRLSEEGLPPVTGLKAQIGGREFFVPTDRIASLEAGKVRLSGENLSLAQFARRPGEVLLREDVLGRKLIDVERAKLVTAHEIVLICVDGWWRLGGIDPRPRGILRRLPTGRSHRLAEDPILSWSQLEAFVGHVPSSRLRLGRRRLADLHPAQIADLVEAASHDEGEEIIEAVGSDRELEADVFEELDDEHQLEFIRERSDAEAAQLLSRMAPDDAADLINEIDQERRLPILSLLPPAKQSKVRTLLGYNPATAGGLMSPEFVSLNERASVATALRSVRSGTDVVPEALSVVFLTDEGERLVGSVSVFDLLRTEEDRPLTEIAERDPQSAQTDEELPEIACRMSDFNLMALPVTDEVGKLVGVVTVDDVLEVLVPEEWRRRARVAQS